MTNKGTLIYYNGGHYWSPAKWKHGPAEAIERDRVGHAGFRWICGAGVYEDALAVEKIKPWIDKLRALNWLPQWPNEWIDLDDTPEPIPDHLATMYAKVFG